MRKEMIKNIIRDNTRKILSFSMALLITITLSSGFSVKALNKTTPIKIRPGAIIILHQDKDRVYVNKIGGNISAKLFIPENAYDKDYKISELKDFFGRDPLPTIPQEFHPSMDSVNVIFNPDNSMLFMSALIYSKDIDDPDAPSIEIKLKKGTLPPKDCIYLSKSVKESVLGDTKIVIGATTVGEKYNDEGKPTAYYDMYTAEFVYKGIGYSITGKNVDGDSFIKMLQSIVK